jgi:hypothetical protein
MTPVYVGGGAIGIGTIIGLFTHGFHAVIALPIF